MLVVLLRDALGTFQKNKKRCSKDAILKLVINMGNHGHRLAAYARDRYLCADLLLTFEDLFSAFHIFNGKIEPRLNGNKSARDVQDYCIADPCNSLRDLSAARHTLSVL